MIDSKDFDDMMPHRIIVNSRATNTNYGRRGGTSPTSRTYKCLLDSSERIRRTETGTTVSTGMSAYINPIPVGASAPVKILDTDLVTLPDNTSPPVEGVEESFDADGSLYAIVLRFG